MRIRFQEYQSFNRSRTRWTVGGGAEWMFAPSWSAKLEYLYADISGGDVRGGLSWNYGASFHPQINILHGGLNYHFNWAPPRRSSRNIEQQNGRREPRSRGSRLAWGSETMRRAFAWIHRYVGLTMALFLIIEGLTGSLPAFRGDLSALLDPSLTAAKPSPDAKRLDLAMLAERAEALMPNATAAYFYRLRDDQAIVRMRARDDPETGKPYPEDPGVIILDPWTGKELGRTPYSGYTQGFLANVLPFVNDLHTALAMGGLGVWILAVLAILSTIDCFAGFYLTLPLRLEKFWKPAWLVKWRGGFYRVNFDLHRASGLWLWAMLFVFAWSSVCLVDQLGVYEKVTAALFDTRPMMEQVAEFAMPREGVGPMKLDWRAAQARGKELVAEKAAAGGFRLLQPKGLTSLSYARAYNYSVETDRSFPADKELVVFFDGDDGSFRGSMSTSTGHLGETLTNWLRALHMACNPVDYLPYRIFVCVLGLVVATLSITGVYVWWKKRKARLFHARHGDSRAASTVREAALSRTHSQPSDV